MKRDQHFLVKACGAVGFTMQFVRKVPVKLAWLNGYVEMMDLPTQVRTLPGWEDSVFGSSPGTAS